MGILQNTTKTIGGSKMLKCPNCGSTAQTRVTFTINEDRTKITETITCGCGSTTTAIYKLEKEETRTKNGTKIK